MAPLLLRVSSSDAGASIILFLLDVAPSGGGTYQAVILLRMQIKGPPGRRYGTMRMKVKTLNAGADGTTPDCLIDRFRFLSLRV